MNPNPRRITQALDERGLYGPQVDAVLGVEEPEVDLWESGEVIPTKAQIKRLALLTGMPPEFFYKPDLTEPLTKMFMCGYKGGDKTPTKVADVAEAKARIEAARAQLKLGI